MFDKLYFDTFLFHPVFVHLSGKCMLKVQMGHLRWMLSIVFNHAGHTRKASRISKAVVDNCDKGVGNFYLS